MARGLGRPAHRPLAVASGVARSSATNSAGTVGRPQLEGRASPRRTRRSLPPSVPGELMARDTTVVSTVSRSSVEADGLAHLTQRLQLPTERASSAVRACSSCEQAHVLDRDDRLVGEGLQQLDLLVGERPDLQPAEDDDADRRLLPHQRGGQDGPEARACWSACASDTRCVANSARMSGTWIVRRSTAARPEGAPDVSVTDVDARDDRSPSRSGPPDASTSPSHPVDEGVGRAAQLRRALRHGVEHRLHVRRRAGDDPEDLAVAVCCSSDSVSSRVRSSTLLLQRGVGLAQPHGHLVELVGQRLQLVAGLDHDPMVQLAGADLGRAAWRTWIGWASRRASSGSRTPTARCPPQQQAGPPGGGLRAARTPPPAAARRTPPSPAA